jgi:nitric oxide reductase large subunit
VTVDEVKQLLLIWIKILWMAMGTRFLKPLFHFPSHKGKKRSRITLLYFFLNQIMCENPIESKKFGDDLTWIDVTN